MNKLATLVNALPRAVQIGMVKRAQYKAGLKKQAAWTPAQAGLTGAGIGGLAGLGAQYFAGDDPSAADYAMAGGAGALAGGAGGLGLQALLAGSPTPTQPRGPSTSVPLPAEGAYDPSVQTSVDETAALERARVLDLISGAKGSWDAMGVGEGVTQPPVQPRGSQSSVPMPAMDSDSLYNQLSPEDKALASRHIMAAGPTRPTLGSGMGWLGDFLPDVLRNLEPTPNAYSEYVTKGDPQLLGR